jgi:hypothetical protein
MGLFIKEKLTEDWALAMADMPRGCLLCGEPLSVPSIFWMGNSQQNAKDRRLTQIWLHPKCAQALATKLNNDWIQYLIRCNEVQGHE